MKQTEIDGSKVVHEFTVLWHEWECDGYGWVTDDGRAWLTSILSNRTDSGCVTCSDPISASRTASRFGFCQPFSDLLGPLLTLGFLNKYGMFWGF